MNANVLFENYETQHKSKEECKIVNVLNVINTPLQEDEEKVPKLICVSIVGRQDYEWLQTSKLKQNNPRSLYRGDTPETSDFSRLKCHEKKSFLITEERAFL